MGQLLSLGLWAVARQPPDSDQLWSPRVAVMACGSTVPNTDRSSAVGQAERPNRASRGKAANSHLNRQAFAHDHNAVLSALRAQRPA